MSIRVIIIGGNPVEISRSAGFTDDNGVQYSAQAHELMTAQELAAIGVYDTVDDAIPSGKVPTGWTLTFAGGQVRRQFTGFADPPVPKSITRYQFKSALLAAGKAADAQTAINAATAAQKLAWSDARNVRRDSDLIAHLKTALSLTDAQIDTFFRNASAIAD